MNTAKQHWPILRRLGTDLAQNVREYMVIGESGDGLLVATDDGNGYWFGNMSFGSSESKTTNKPISLCVFDLVSMAQGHQHILLLNKRGHLYSMGRNNRGQLGLGTVDEETYFSLRSISSQQKFTSVRCGHGHSVALTEDGKVWAWGDNEYGQVGGPDLPDPIASPFQITELDQHRVVALECGAHHSLALTDQGEVYAWGENSFGQLGDGSKSSTYIPTRISAPSPVKSMTAGYKHTLLLTRTGEVWACGSNDCCQLGLPTDTKSSASLVKVAGVSSISQIASHPATHLSIAISSRQQCFVWGLMHDGTTIFTLQELPLFYSTVESSLSFYSSHRSTPHSISIPVTPPSRLSVRMSKMFNNPETSDVQFVVEKRTIHAHLIIMRNFSDYFAQMFSERWLDPVDPEDPIVKVTIADHSYEAFHAFLRFLYTDSFEVYPDLISKLIDIANYYLVPDLFQACLLRMRNTLTPVTCCLYYQLTYQHSISKLDSFRLELVQFASTRMSEIASTSAYQSMEPELRDNLTNAVQLINPNL